MSLKCKLGFHKWGLTEIYTQSLEKPLKSGKETVTQIEYRHYECKKCNKKIVEPSHNLFYLAMKQKDNKENKL
jgi:hypothetical protein